MKGERERTCCFSGHRPPGLPQHGDEESGPIIRLKERLYDEVVTAFREGYDTFICGMADGFDTFAGEAVLALKAQGFDARLVAAVPFAGHGDKLAAGRRARYRRILDAADEVKVLAPCFSRHAYTSRNRYMVDRSRLLICCFDGRTGGTAQTVYYAAGQGLAVVNLWESACEGRD